MCQDRCPFGLFPAALSRQDRVSAWACQSGVVTLSSVELAEQLVAWVLKRGSTLKQLRVSFSVVQGQQQAPTGPLLKALAAAAIRLERLELIAECQPGEQVAELTGGSCLAALSHLQHVTLNNFDVTATALAAMCRLPQLTCLDLSGSDLTHVDLAMLGEKGSAKLTSLVLSGAKLNPHHLTTLHSLPCLEELHLRGIGLKEDHLSSLQGLPVSSMDICITKQHASEKVGAWLASSGRVLQSLGLRWEVKLQKSRSQDVECLLSPLASAAPKLKDLEMHRFQLCHPRTDGLLEDLHIDSLTLYNCNVMRELFYGLKCSVTCQPPLIGRSGY